MIQSELLEIADVLSFYWCEGIDQSYSKHEWLPENEDEEGRLDVLSGEIDRKRVSITDVEAMPSSIVMQAVIAADQDDSEELELSFFRLGTVALKEERYIEAFYHFFFVLETNYSGGKFKTKEVVRNFENASALVADINDEISALPESLAGVSRDLAEKVVEVYQGKDARFAIERLVGRRGFLHHHTSADKGRWHPDKSRSIRPDVLFLQQIAFKTAWRIVARRLWSERVLHIYSNFEAR